MVTTKQEKARIAERLRKAREDIGLTQAALAKNAGLSRSSLVHYENAAAIPGGTELIKLCNALSKTPNFLLSGSEEFHASQLPEHTLATDDMPLLISRMTLCLITLDRDVREKMSELLMSLVKQKLNQDEFHDFILAIGALSDSIGEMESDVESMVDKLAESGRFTDLEKEMKSTKSGKKSKSKKGKS